MPYKSTAQRAYMHIHHPAIAARWDKKYGGGGSHLPRHVRRKRALKKLAASRKMR